MEEDNDKDEDKDLLREKVNYFYKNNLPVHVIKKNKEWLNGEIIEVSADFFILKENKEGEVPVFYLEVFDIEKFKEEKNEEGRLTQN